MSELVPGGNIRLPGGAVTVRVPGPFDVSALITDDGRKVSGDADFVFYNQPAAPGARLGGDTLVVDPAALRAGATRVTVAVSPEEPGTPLSALPAPVLEVTGPGGRALARFRPPRPDRETVLLLAEIYRRGDGWKLRALGQGYADGLAGLARDFGVDVEDDEGAVSTRTAPVVTGRAPVSPGTTPQAAPRTHPVVPPRPAAPPSAGDDFLTLVNSARRAAGSPRGGGPPRGGGGGPGAPPGGGRRGGGGGAGRRGRAR
ncbi:TerD family protein, partial [Streptomyces albogriseolus]